MTVRDKIIDAAARLLADSTDGDISTRAVCEASGVQQPALYRIFGDKAGLLEATIDRVWDTYLNMKRSAEQSDDPLADLRQGWDSHTAFALAHPNAYRLLFGSHAVARAESAAEALRLLEGVLERLAAQGRLRVEPAVAAQQVMAANSGLALALILRPQHSDDPQLIERMREGVIRSILLPDGESANPAAGVVGAEPQPRSQGTPRGNSDVLVAAAISLRSGLRSLERPQFTSAELALLDEWLARIPAHAEISTTEGE